MPWLKRVSTALACVLCAAGGLVLSAWFFQLEKLVQWQAKLAPISANTAAGFAFVGLVLLAVELGTRRAAWAALLVAVLGLFTLLEDLAQVNLGIDEWLFRDTLGGELAHAGRMAPIVSICFLITGVALPWLAAQKGVKIRTLGLAVGGSVLLSIGFSTLLGYGLSLPAVYRWGSSASTPPGTAILLLVLGAALLLLAWREQQAADPGPPTWLPIPVVVGSATLTLILWAGLRERQVAYLGNDTRIAINSVASAINGQIEQQAGALDRIARRWGQAFEADAVIWETDAYTHLNEAPFCRSIAWVEATGNYRTAWYYPKPRNEALNGLVQGDDPVRLHAIQAARDRGAPTVSGSLKLPTGAGFVIYAPVYRGGRLAGFVAGEYLYRAFFENVVVGQKKPGPDYKVIIDVGPERIYESAATFAVSEGDALEIVADVFDRRIRVRLAPADEFLRRKRGYLPELALAAGFGITLLLGLSVHLARAARTGLRAAETSNRRLIAENEERRRVEAMLKVSDERLRLALDSTQIGIFEWNLTTNQLYYSPGLWTMLGYHPGQIAATPEAWTALIHPEDLPSYRTSIETQLAGSTPFIDPEYRVRSGNGDWRWLYVREKAVTRSASGAPTRIIGTMQDVTARKEAEQALRASQAEARKLSLVASRTDNLVIIGSPNGAIDWVNDSFERVMEYTLDEVRGKNPATFMVGPETNPRTIRRIRAAMTRGEGVSTDVVNYSKSGRKYHLHLEIQPVRNEQGLVETFIAIEADITSRVETESNLRRAKAEADNASRAKSEFLASMSHEIRTPMNGVIGMTSLLLETSLSLEQRDFVNTIRTSGEALLTIINDILDFSKIESGKMELERLPFELSVCVEEALDLFSVQAAAKKLELVYFIDPAVPAWILGDVTRLRQVLVNLVNNAVKFTPGGSISIEVRAARVPADKILEPGAMLIEVAIRDSGIGIPPDRVDRLFKPFSQVDSSTTRKYGGTGLGLAICHRLCALMGGDIRVESQVGQGSSFIFTLQTEGTAPARDSQLPPLPDGLRAATVLCIEDNTINNRRLVTFFRSWGTLAMGVTSRDDALAVLAQPDRPGAVVVDLELVSGPAGAELRERIGLLEVPTLLLLPPGQSSVHAFGDRRLFATAGKPLKTLTLVRGIQTLFHPLKDALATPAPQHDTKLLAEEIPLDVLLVEDNAVNQKVALRFLERLGYRADAVANGLEGVTTLEARHYHLVLMDLQMPEMDGFEASRQIRRRLPAHRQPKIVALTANALQGDRELCLEAGMDDYVTKPVKLHEIADCIRRQFAPVPVPPGERLIG